MLGIFSGTVAGKTYGVAKDANIVAVKILSSKGTGTLSSVLGGVDFVSKQRQQTGRPTVINMSVSGNAISPSLDDAVDEADREGVVFVTSAGNRDSQACSVSPAASWASITAAASDNSDWRIEYSNYGKCVDIFAPGLNIISAGFEQDNAISYKSGTSMASPHVAGAVALYLEAHPDWSSEMVRQALLQDATRNAIYDVKDGTPNLLLNIASIQAPVPTPRPNVPRPVPVPVPVSAPEPVPVVASAPRHFSEITQVAEVEKECGSVLSRCEFDGDCCGIWVCRRGLCWI